jgi:hypothetical protein
VTKVAIVRTSDGEVILNCINSADAEHYDLAGCELVELDGIALELAEQGFPLNYSDGQLQPPLDLLRARARQRINTEREARKDAGCDTAIGRVDSDPASRANVTGAATAAMIAQAAAAPFEINWTLADNSTVALDAPSTIGMGLAVLAHVSAVHDEATALKTAIDAAETAEDIAAVAWPI